MVICSYISGYLDQDWEQDMNQGSFIRKNALPPKMKDAQPIK